MRYHAPSRTTIDPLVFERAPLSHWHEYAGWLQGDDWPTIEALNAARPTHMRERFVVQTRTLLDDGLHYEQRIAERGEIATREANWHDLFNALIWLRYPEIKRALNTQQMREITLLGTKQRSRPQYAQTHFDEAGVLVVLRDPSLLGLWDTHDWHGLFWRARVAWGDGRIEVVVFGHALLEHALTEDQLIVGKAVVVELVSGQRLADGLAACAAGIPAGRILRDPQGLRPLPLSGIPGWHRCNDNESFYREAPCFRSVRDGRCYPPPMGARS